MAEQDYCQYIISKCVNKGCFLATNGMFRTTKAFLESYENSSSFLISARARDNRIIEWFLELIKETIQNSRDLDADCRKSLVVANERLMQSRQTKSYILCFLIFCG